MTVKRNLTKLNGFLSGQMGIDVRRFLRSARGVPRFVRDWRRFRHDYEGALSLMPCLQDWDEEGGGTRDEYFWQDLLVAKWIFEARPEKHVDIGSRVDGFVAHVASFREIEVFDVRPMTARIPGVVFKQADLTRPVAMETDGGGYCDSLSCLHAVEHFGLGRYGDAVDPQGAERGIANMARLLKPGGRFYLSSPIGRERVEFNAHRVSDPRTLIRWASTNGLRLQALTVVANGTAHETAATDEELQTLAMADYGLGILVFEKQSR